jgi:dihydroorotate dehydrogenase electron transfer subunit
MKDLTFTVVSNTKLTERVFELVLFTENLPKFEAGMFANIGIPNRTDLILKRPFCLHTPNYEENTVCIAFDVLGKGTKALSELTAGQKLDAVMPLGNPFPKVEKGRKIMLVGGGTGVLPLLAVAQTYPDAEIYSFLGFANKKDVMKVEEYKKLSKNLYVCTDDGTYGERGYVTETVSKKYGEICPDYVFGCGPDVMTRCLSPYRERSEIYLTMEGRMACGVGACLVCACKTKQENGETYMKRVCADGPVFKFEQVFYE